MGLVLSVKNGLSTGLDREETVGWKMKGLLGSEYYKDLLHLWGIWLYLTIFEKIEYIWHKVGWCIAACDLHVHVWPFSFPSQSLKESAFVSWHLGRNERARFLASFCRMDLPDIYIYIYISIYIIQAAKRRSESWECCRNRNSSLCANIGRERTGIALVRI